MRDNPIVQSSSLLLVLAILTAGCGGAEPVVPQAGVDAGDISLDAAGADATDAGDVETDDTAQGDGSGGGGSLDTAALFLRLRPSCLPCHEAAMEFPALGSLEQFEELIVADDNYVTPGDPENSQLVVLLEGRADGLFGQMPPDGPTFSARAEGGQTQLTMAQIYDWIANLPPRDEPVVDCDAINPGPAPMRRLAATEYENVVRDLLGVDIEVANTFPPEDETLGFNNNAEALGVTQLQAEKYFEAAQMAGAAALADPISLVDHLGVGCRDVEPACIEQFVRRLAYRAYRRPLASGEAARIAALYDIGFAQRGDFRDGLSLIVEGVLQSPHFLYRVEFGEIPDADATVVPLTSYEMASRLSFFLWNSMPDQALFAVADAGELRTGGQIEAQARRMVDDPRARQAVTNFHRQWLRTKDLTDTSKSAQLFPEWNEGLADDLLAGQDAFVEYVVWGEGSLDELFTAPYAFMNASTADFYSIGGVSGDGFTKVDLDGDRFAGIVTAGATLATHAHTNQTSPIKRGVFVREKLLCQPLPQPPDNVDNSPPDFDADATTRERFAAHTESDSCRTCHELIDPIGFGFENYDAVGRYRATENGSPIDATGTIIGTDDMDGDFDGAVALAHSLANSEQVHQCFVRQWFRFGHGRSEKPEDVCTLDALFADFEAADLDIRELLVAFTQTDAFLYRPIVQGSE